MLEIQLKKSVEIIAEAGCNHGGDLEDAKLLVRAAAECGADYIKFQTYLSQNLINPGGELLKFCKKAELSFADHLELIRCCKENNIGFLSSAFCIQSLTVLKALGLDTIKVPSGQIFNREYLRFLGKMKKCVLLSTGMCTISDVTNAVETLCMEGTEPSQITLMQCTTAYPAPHGAANLSVIPAYKDFGGRTGIRSGYSDHTSGWATSLAAVALGASVIEKHFTMVGLPETPDTPVSLTELDFEDMVQEIRQVESAMGYALKRPQPCERAMEHRKNVVTI